MNLKMLQRTEPVAQVSKPAVSPISKSAGRTKFCSLPAWKPAIQQTWKSALLAGALLVAASAAAQSTNGTGFAQFQMIGQRNIFDPDRVPNRPYARSAPKVVDSFSFVGTMSYAKGTFAFFDGTSADFRKVLERDGEILGFKVVAISPKAVTLRSGTNETVLKLGTQMHRDDNGQWVVSTETVSYGGSGSSYASSSNRRFSNRRQHNNYGSGQNNFLTATTAAAGNSQPDNSDLAAQEGMTDAQPDSNPPDLSPPPGGGANDALTRLRQLRAQEEQQLGAGR